MENEKYNGFDVRFDKKDEVWYACVDENGKQAKYNSPETKVCDASLKKLKEKLDIIKRKKFDRFPIFMRNPDNRYRREDDPFIPTYIRGTVTSVSPNGYIYVVAKGKKHGDKFNSRWDHLIEDNLPNAKLIEQYEIEARKEYDAKHTQKGLEEKFKYIKGEDLFLKVYGKKLQ